MKTADWAGARSSQVIRVMVFKAGKTKGQREGDLQATAFKLLDAPAHNTGPESQVLAL